MGQREILLILNKYKYKEFSAEDLALLTKVSSSSISESLRKLRRSKLLNYKQQKVNNGKYKLIYFYKK